MRLPQIIMNVVNHGRKESPMMVVILLTMIC